MPRRGCQTCTVIIGAPATTVVPAASGGGGGVSSAIQNALPFFGVVQTGEGQPANTYFLLSGTGSSPGLYGEDFAQASAPFARAGVVTRVRYNVTDQEYVDPVTLSLWRAPPVDVAPTDTGAFGFVVSPGAAPVAATVDGALAFAAGDRLAIGISVPEVPAGDTMPTVRVQGSLWIRFEPTA